MGCDEEQPQIPHCVRDDRRFVWVLWLGRRLCVGRTGCSCGCCGVGVLAPSLRDSEVLGGHPRSLCLSSEFRFVSSVGGCGVTCANRSYRCGSPAGDQPILQCDLLAVTTEFLGDCRSIPRARGPRAFDSSSSAHLANGGAALPSDPARLPAGARDAQRCSRCTCKSGAQAAPGASRKTVAGPMRFRRRCTDR